MSDAIDRDMKNKINGKMNGHGKEYGGSNAFKDNNQNWYDLFGVIVH